MLPPLAQSPAPRLHPASRVEAVKLHFEVACVSPMPKDRFKVPPEHQRVGTEELSEGATKTGHQTVRECDRDQELGRYVGVEEEDTQKPSDIRGWRTPRPKIPRVLDSFGMT